MRPVIPRHLYIIGDARSGSTILSAVLGSQARIVGTGELSQLLLDDVGEPRICACGRSIEECPLWGPVLTRWSRALAPGVPADYLHLQARYERFRGLPRLILESRRRSASFETYTRWTTDLLASIREVESVDAIVDSSKAPVRALAILLGGMSELGLIHNVRDPRGVAWSKLKVLRWRDLPTWLRSPGAIVLRAAFDWAVANGTTEILRRHYRDVPYVRIRYEDLADDPARTIRHVGASLNLELESLADRAANGELFAFSHVMAGNLARRKPPRALVKDEDWRTSAPGWVKCVVWAICGCLARRYGYGA